MNLNPKGMFPMCCENHDKKMSLFTIELSANRMKCSASVYGN